MVKPKKLERMRRFVTTIVSAIALATAVSAVPAAASVPAGGCTLHAYNPIHDGNNTGLGRGRVDHCSVFQQLSLYVCVQIRGANGRSWFNARDFLGQFACGGDVRHWATWDDFSTGFRPAAGHVYRSNVTVYFYTSAGTVYKTYSSSGCTWGAVGGCS